MPTAKVHEHLQRVMTRLEAITIALLSENPGARTTLMAERRLLLADVTRTCNTLEQPESEFPSRSAPSRQQNLRFIKRPAIAL